MKPQNFIVKISITCIIAFFIVGYPNVSLSSDKDSMEYKQLQKIKLSKKIDKSDLSILLRINRVIYKINGSLEFDVLLINNSEAPIYIYKNLDLGETSSISVWFKSLASGKPVGSAVIYDAMEPINQSNSSFLSLLPEYIYGAKYKIYLSDFNFENPGKYVMEVTYHSPVSRKEKPKLRLWGSEMGDISSNQMTITITR